VYNNYLRAFVILTLSGILQTPPRKGKGKGKERTNGEEGRNLSSGRDIKQLMNKHTTFPTVRPLVTSLIQTNALALSETAT